MNKKYFVPFAFSVLLGSLFSINFAFADNCPNKTTVNGRSVTFVGELTDTGGDSNTSVWFEYGKNNNYGQKTSEKILGQEGVYCISISNLDTCTTYHYRAAARNSADTSYGEDKSFTTTCGPTVDIKANGSDGPVDISYGSSVNLTWTSENADYCTASGDWSGSKSISGSQSTGDINSSREYRITCAGSAGSETDSVRINVGTSPSLTLKKLVRNLSDGTPFYEQVTADPGEVVSFSIEVKADNAQARDVIVRDILPSQMVYQADTLKINGLSSSGDIASGLDIGDLAANEQKTITFSAQIAGSTSFTFGTTQLTNSATASGSNVSASDSAKVIVIRKAVAGATTIPTGLTNNLFFDSFAFPLFLALMLLWFLKSNIIKFEQWVDKRKQEYQSYKSKKILGIKTKKIRLREMLKEEDIKF